MFWLVQNPPKMDEAKNNALLFFIDHLMQKNGVRTIHDLSWVNLTLGPFNTSTKLAANLGLAALLKKCVKRLVETRKVSLFVGILVLMNKFKVFSISFRSIHHCLYWMRKKLFWRDMVKRTVRTDSSNRSRAFDNGTMLQKLSNFSLQNSKNLVPSFKYHLEKEYYLFLNSYNRFIYID